MISFADALVTQKTKGTTRLEKIDALINWKRFGYRLEKLLDRGKDGRPPYPVLSMFKAMILQRLYNFSDPEMEEMLYDRISFRRFCGFGLSDRLPDETTICRFRQLLGDKANSLLQLVLEDLSTQGLTMKGGAIVDATIISSRAKQPQGGEVSRTDPEAGWTKKRGEYHHGYKMHACVDAEHGLVHGLSVTSADVHDSLVFAQLIDEEDQVVYADKAYDSQKNRRILEENDIECRILYKGKRNQIQPNWQKHLNGLWNKTRSGVERTFAHLKGNQGLGQARYFGLKKNAVWATFNAIAYNLSRAANILGPQLSRARG
jgi:IS5 family transposase